MKNNFLYVLLLNIIGFITPIFAQKIDSVNYKGKNYYIYPFKETIRPNDNYFQIIDKKQWKDIFFLFNRMPDFYTKTEAEKKQLYKAFKKQIKFIYKNLDHKKFDHELKAAIIKNPYPLLTKNYLLEKDIIPCLDKIPDGNYIQYFEEIPIPDGKGGIKKESVPAGFFSIKNNALHGYSCWLDVSGDTVKSGYFINGLKDGEWKLISKKLTNRRIDEESKKCYIEKGYPLSDTIREIVTFKNGIKNGYYKIFENTIYPTSEGFYVNNEKAGSWIERKPPVIFLDDFTSKKDKNNLKITSEYTYNDDKTVISKEPIIRHFLIENAYENEDYNFDANYNPTNFLSSIYTLNNKNLTNEDIIDEDNQYSEMEYEEEYSEEESEYVDDTYDFEYYDNEKDSYISMSKMIDSVGYTLNFKGIFEKHYPNGQLMVKYVFENNKLEKEDTIFWDNGKVYDVIQLKQDSNQYIRSIYDYDGKLYKEFVYDSLGKFVRLQTQPKTSEIITLHNKPFVNDYESSFYYYDQTDSIHYLLDLDTICLWHSINKVDKKDNYIDTYIPSEKTLYSSEYTINGNKRYQNEVIFGDTYTNWTGKDSLGWNKLALKTLKSGAYNELKFDKDTIPVRNVVNYEQNFDITKDMTLYHNNKPFTGKLNLTFNSTKPTIKVDKNIKIELEFFEDKIIATDFEKYLISGKTKYKEFYDFIKAAELVGFDYNEAIMQFFDPIRNFITPLNQYDVYNYVDGENAGKKNKEKDIPPFTKNIKGQYIDGKPSGKWLFYNQFGKITCEIFFKNGLPEGEVNFYDIAYAPVKVKKEEYDEYLPQNNILSDSLPKKDTYYLSSTLNYKNGLRQGPTRTYNWCGQIISEENYVDDYMEGRAYERNGIAYTTSNYHYGYLDGYLETYLILPGKDSILIYSIDFKDGALQGESKSFHLNGKLSKRGFFLNGLPIDDYEAYDSLGFKYHYVKFLYSFPVEEKIWEENQLSVRYTFDWKDSIYFRPTDITSSQSLERQLANLGIGMEYFNQPYYGRPSLVEKRNIKYGLTKYYSNDTIARDGFVKNEKKIGLWKYNDYNGRKLYEINYFDSIIKWNDSISFSTKGIYFEYDSLGTLLSKSYIVEKYEKYDCSHSDHYEIRQFVTFWEKDKNARLNGYVKHYYDNGVLQSEGNMKNGLPDGVWKFYDPYGKLNHVGTYFMGKRNGRWLGGDLSKTKYLGDICLNPNLPDIEETIKIREKQLDITITNYNMGKALNKEFYDVDWSEVEKE